MYDPRLRGVNFDRLIGDGVAIGPDGADEEHGPGSGKDLPHDSGFKRVKEGARLMALNWSGSEDSIRTEYREDELNDLYPGPDKFRAVRGSRACIVRH